ncbi:MAG: PfkB family carbohydrate kinase [Hyphomicrobiaceae bacterium]
MNVTNSNAILALSSTVAVGHVGLSAIVPTLGLLGHSSAALPTVVLSNHPGFAQTAGMEIPVGTLDAMVEAIAGNGWIGDFGTILTGYLPSVAHVAFAAGTIARVRAANPAARYVCDPVIGDDPKGLYIDAAAAEAVRERLIPLADAVLPNRFELSYLADRPVTSPNEAIVAARALSTTQVIAKSTPLSGDWLRNIDIRTGSVTSVTVPRQAGAPNGTGDMFSALIAAGWSLERATSALSTIIAASGGDNHLAIIGASGQWLNARPVTLDSIG